MDDERYLRGRAELEARRAEAAGSLRVRRVHEELARSCRERADALGTGTGTGTGGQGG